MATAANAAESRARVSSTAVTREAHRASDAPHVAFFVSDSTGITAETIGSALLVNFPAARFEHRARPFVDDRDAVARVAAEITEAADRGPTPLVFTTIKRHELRDLLAATPAVVIDLIGDHLSALEAALGMPASEQLGQYHGIGDLDRYQARMQAIEFAMEHDDASSYRDLGAAHVILLGPSRCGKTPTTMYLAMHDGLRVANYPLTDDDFPDGGAGTTDALPHAIAPFASRCFGLTTTPQRLHQARHERRPGTRYASLEQCVRELKRAEALYARHDIPFVNSAAKSVEEMSAVITQALGLRG